MDDDIVIGCRPAERGWAMLLHRRLVERFGRERVHLDAPTPAGGGVDLDTAGPSAGPTGGVYVVVVPGGGTASRSGEPDGAPAGPLAEAVDEARRRGATIVPVAVGAGGSTPERGTGPAQGAALGDVEALLLSPRTAVADLQGVLDQITAALAPPASPRPTGDGPRRLEVGPAAPEHRTIAAALRAAAPGSTIVVHPGVYAEPLFLAGDVELVGEGEPGEVVVEVHTGVAVRSTAPTARLHNLTVRGPTAGPTVLVTAGTLTIDGCDVAPVDDVAEGGAQAIGVKVAGERSTLRMHASRVGRTHFGVGAIDGSRLVVERSEVHDCHLSGIAIESGADATVSRTSTHGHGQNGVLLTGAGRGAFDELEAHGNDRGVTVDAHATATLRRCRLHDNRSVGFASTSGTARLEGCELVANGASALFAWGRSHVEVEGGCTARGATHGSIVHGVVASGEAEVSLDGVEVSDNPGQGALGNVDATLRLVRCTVQRNRLGIVTSDRAALVVEDTEVRAQERSGLLLGSSTEASVRGCEVEHNGDHGLAVHPPATVLVEGGRIAGNGGAGLLDEGDGSQIRGAVVRDNEHGAFVLGSGTTLDATDVEVDGTHHDTWSPDGGADGPGGPEAPEGPEGPDRSLERFLITATDPERTYRDGAFRRADGMAVHPGPGPGNVDLDTPRGPIWLSPARLAGPLGPASHVMSYAIDRWVPLPVDHQPDLDDPLVGIDVRRPIGPSPEPGELTDLEERWASDLQAEVVIDDDGHRYRLDLADEPMQVAWPVPQHHEVWEVAWSVPEQAWVSWSDHRSGWVRWDVRRGRWLPAEHDPDWSPPLEPETPPEAEPET